MTLEPGRTPAARRGNMLRLALKGMVGGTVALANRQCRFDNAVFVLGHMRCGSTALSNVLCGHEEISGYGEAHMRYIGRSTLGLLVLSQMRRGCWRPRARRLFDKILHSWYDQEVDPRFFDARAVFLVREPRATLLSISTLFDRVGGRLYRTDEQAADYYEARLADLARSWERFPAANRRRVLHADLTGDPDGVLAGVGAMLGVRRPLENRYTRSMTERRGTGDPLSAGRFDAIVTADRATSVASREIMLSRSRLDALDRGFRSFIDATAG